MSSLRTASKVKNCLPSSVPAPTNIKVKSIVTKKHYKHREWSRLQNFESEDDLEYKETQRIHITIVYKIFYNLLYLGCGAVHHLITSPDNAVLLDGLWKTNFFVTKRILKMF